MLHVSVALVVDGMPGAEEEIQGGCSYCSKLERALNKKHVLLQDIIEAVLPGHGVLTKHELSRCRR
jgi:hypothetical protein